MSSYFLGKRLIFHRSIPAGIALAGSFVLCLPDAAAQTIATDPPQDGCDRPCPSRHRHRRAKLDESYDGGTTGLRLSTTRVDGSDADTPGGDFGLQLGGSNESYGAKGLLNFRSAGFGFIGGGELGFEGGFGGDAAVGLRGKFSRYQGPFLRLGLRGHLLGNDRLYSSMLEVPQVQLGYQWLRDGAVFEIGWRAGAVLVGRYNTGQDTRLKLGSAWEAGGHVAVHVNPVHFEMAQTSVLLEGVDERMDQLSGTICGESWILRLCTDARYYRGDSNLPGATRSRSVQAFYGGFTLGIRQGALRPPPPGG